MADSAEPSSLTPPAPTPRRSSKQVARQAVVATVLLYGAFASARLVLPVDASALLLVAAFYFLPGWLLRDDPERQTRYQVGPDRVLPPWTQNGWRWGLIAIVVVLAPFVFGFWAFYARVCAGELGVVAPVLAIEQLVPSVPWAGQLERFFARVCEGHAGDFFPEAVRVPSAWLEWGGLGVVVAIAVELFAVALPEELFHRGYLMSALEERWAPRRRVLGVPFGWAAVLSSLLFALGHLVSLADIARLATFFPSLVFAWLWRKSGSLWAPALFHAAANLLMAVLLASTLGV